ncbi:MAG TPA: response regulator [Candidatus Limnocylindrales bacterium]
MAYKLLLADDSVTIQRVIELTFADEDVQVVAVGDGQQAIERIDADPPDIILADVDMPKRNGYEVAAYVKSRPNLAHIPVVLLTGAFEPIDQARATAAGSDDVLAKPFEPQMVINRVKQLLGRAVEGGARKAPPASGVDRSASPAMPPVHDVMVGEVPSEMPAIVTDPAMDVLLTGPDRGAGGAHPSASLDEYFDQLDAAFAHLQPGHSSAETEPASTVPGAAREDLDWIPSRAQAPAEAPPDEWDLRDLPDQPPIEMAGDAAEAPARPVPARAHDLASIRPAVEAQMPEPRAAGAPAPAPASPPPSIADAFAALLAAEEGEPAPPMGAGIGMPSGASGVTEPLIDEVVARVLQRLSDRVVRERATEMVSRIAERLVREEIDRIKGHTK